jgi:aminopeptidase
MNDYARRLAELVVRIGANVQPGQIVVISSEPGKEKMARAVAEAAYKAGALYVELSYWDIYFKRARLLYGDPDTLEYVPPWLGQRMLSLGEHGAARIALFGPAEPDALDGIDPALIGRDRLPAVKESVKVLNDRTTNWTATSSPTVGWAKLVYPDLEPEDALARLWDAVAEVCRLHEPDPLQAWRTRVDQLASVAERLNDLGLDSLRFEGPGTSLSIGLLPSSKWISASLETVGGIVHLPNLPTEEVFTSPDPERVEGTVRSTKPLFVGGTVIEGLRVRFEGGRAVEIDANSGAAALRTLSERDPGAARLGEVALVDRESRIGRLGTVFYDTLLDENAASHIALGQGLAFAIAEERDRERMNSSELHIDFMIGSNDVSVTGVTHDGRDVPLLLGGAWQI